MTAKLRLLAPLLLLAAACGSDKTTYSYAKVNVAIDPQTVDNDVRFSIIACGVTVSGATNDQFNLPSPPCTKGQVPYDFGAFRFTTTVESGQLDFRVTFRDIARKIVAEGTASVTIVPEATAEGSLLAVGTAEPDAGP